MNILCTICSDLVNQAENIYVTKCGHIFHHQCLAQWIERSKTCPQCRNKVTDKCMFRLYPTVSNENNSEDAATLQSRLDDAQLQLRQQRVKYKEKEEKLTVATADLKRQDDLLKSYEKRLVSFDSKVLALREQLEFISTQNKELHKVKEENMALKMNMVTLNGLQKVLNATQDDVEQMLHSYSDLRTIATFATALKRALCDSEAKKNESRDRLHTAKQQLALERKTVGELQSKVSKLEDDLVGAEEKYDILKRKYVAKTTPPTPKSQPSAEEPLVIINHNNSSFTEDARETNDCVDGDIKDLERRKTAAWLNVLSSKATKMLQLKPEETPQYQERYNELKRKIKAIIRMKNEDRLEREKDYENYEKQKTEEFQQYVEQNGLVDSIEKSDSPYLSLKQGNVLSLAALQRAPLKLPDNAQKSEHVYLNAVKNAHQKRIGEQSNAKNSSSTRSIFHKKEALKIDIRNDNIPSAMDISYDGLGGHSKPDVFPVPNNTAQTRIPKLSAKHKLKRPNPTGSQDIEKMLKKVKNK